MSQWQVETTEDFDRDYRKLDRAVQRRVIAYLEAIEQLDDPRQRGITADRQPRRRVALPRRRLSYSHPDH